MLFPMRSVLRILCLKNHADQRSRCVFVASRRCLHDTPYSGAQTRPAEHGHETRKRDSGSQLTLRSSHEERRRESWREWCTVDELQRIDTLTYLLGRYPPSDKTTPTVKDVDALTRSSKEGQTTTAPAPSCSVSRATTSTAGPSTAPLRVKTSLQTKKKKLDDLNARALPTANKTVVPRTSSTTPVPPPNLPVSQLTRSPAKAVSRLWAHHTDLSSSSPTIPPVEKGPFTALEVVEQLARQWWRTERRVQAKQARHEAAEEAAWASLLRHPSHLFTEDAAVYSRFGMGGYVSPNLPGFTALFRQQWQDFHVTEMVQPPPGPTMSSYTATPAMATQGLPCDAVPLSRDFDFSIPPLPRELLDGAADEEGGEEEDKDGERGLSFFAVDVRQRIQELQAETLHERDLAAAAEVLSMEQRNNSSPAGSGSLKERSAHEETRTNLSVDSEENSVGAPHTAEGTSHTTMTERDATTLSINNNDNGHTGVDSGALHAGRRFLQCTLHKQHIAHGNALATIAQTMRIHPRSISVAGIKDYVGDTVQRVRLENVSPASALAANRRFRQKRLKMTLSDFSYEAAPLSPGDLFGNHFRVVLRDVDVPKSELADAVAAFVEKGFPNYYGCQRFSWFAGRNDAAFALLRHNWLAFAFLFLNFTCKDRSLRELLQRPKKYPHPAQDEYRRGVVRRLRQIAVSPADLDVAPFLSCPTLNAPLTHADGRPFSEVEELICAQLREAYFDLNVQSRRLTAQRLSSYLWNQVLTLRLHHLGGEKILDGDLVAPAAIRQLSTDVDDRQDWYHIFGDRVTRENRHRYTIEDVVHPGFSFDAIALPDNVVGAYYEQICGKYALDWMAQHSRSGLRDFREPPRPIIRKPLNLSYDYNDAARVLTLRFALERGCYANVALSELMKSVRCLGSEEVTLLPLPDALWDALGEADPGYVTTLQDIYGGYEDGVGFMNDEAPVELTSASQPKVWDLEGPLFLPFSEDPFRKAHRWGTQHLLRNSERREKEAEDMKQLLFDRPLANQLREGEVDTYAGHIVPLPPNASAKEVYAKVMRRKRRYAGAPRMATRMKRSTSPTSHRGGRGAKRLPSFQSLNKNSWNFTW